MCEPVSIGMAVTSLVSAGLQGKAAREGSKVTAQNVRNRDLWNRDRFEKLTTHQQAVGKWQKDQYEAATASMNQSITGQFGAVLNRLDQERRRTLDQNALYDAAAEANQSRLRAAGAGETTGNSVLLAQRAYAAGAARQINKSYQNLDARFRQAQREMLAYQASGQSQLNRMIPAPMAPIDPVQPAQQVASPSMLPYFVQGVSGALGAVAHAQRTGVFNTPSAPATGPMMGPEGSGVFQHNLNPNQGYNPFNQPGTQAPYYISARPY